MQRRMVLAVVVSGATCVLAGTGVATAATGHGLLGFHGTPSTKTSVEPAAPSAGTGAAKKKRIEIIDKVVQVNVSTTAPTTAPTASPASVEVDATPAQASSSSVLGESEVTAAAPRPASTAPTSATTRPVSTSTTANAAPGNDDDLDLDGDLNDDDLDDDDDDDLDDDLDDDDAPRTAVSTTTTTRKPSVPTKPATSTPKPTAATNSATTRPPIPADCFEPEWEHGHWKCDTPGD